MQNEKRKFPRNVFFANIIVIFKSKSKAITYDISRSGINFIAPVSSCRMLPNDVCTIHLKMLDNIYKIKCTIKRFKFTDKQRDMLNYSAEFEKPLSPEQFEMYVKNHI